MSMPILILDQHALNPRFGYVFNRRWLQPYESVVCMLWKFARMNRLEGHFLIEQLLANPVDPYLGLRPMEIDVPIVARLLGATRRSVREGIDAAAFDASQFLRSCSRCMSLGYHGVVHQRERHEQCPIHLLPLLAACRHCGEASAYRLDAQLLEAPFRCRHCRRTYGSNSPPLRCKELSRERRVAVTRAVIG